MPDITGTLETDTSELMEDGSREDQLFKPNQFGPLKSQPNSMNLTRTSVSNQPGSSTLQPDTSPKSSEEDVSREL